MLLVKLYAAFWIAVAWAAFVAAIARLLFSNLQKGLKPR